MEAEGGAMKGANGCYEAGKGLLLKGERVAMKGGEGCYAAVTRNPLCQPDIVHRPKAREISPQIKPCH